MPQLPVAGACAAGLFSWDFALFNDHQSHGQRTDHDRSVSDTGRYRPVSFVPLLLVVSVTLVLLPLSVGEGGCGTGGTGPGGTGTGDGGLHILPPGPSLVPPLSFAVL